MAKTRISNGLKLILSAGMIVSAAALICKVIAAVRELVSAYYFGTGTSADNFALAFGLAASCVNVFAVSFATAVTPTYAALLENRKSENCQGLVFKSFLALTLILSCLGLLASIFADNCLTLLASNLPPEQIQQASKILFLLVPYFVFHGLSALAVGLLNYHGKLIIAGLSPIPIHLFGIAVLVIFLKDLGIEGLATGMTVGAFIQLCYLLYTLRRLKLVGLPNADDKFSLLAPAYRQYLPLMGGSLLMTSTVIVDQVMAAWLGQGSVASITYASRVSYFFLDIASLALSTVAFPIFSALVAKKAYGELKSALIKGTVIILGCSIFVAIALSVLSKPLVGLVLERGSFTSADTDVVAGIQSILAFQIPFFLLGILYTRALPALGKSSWILLGTIISVVLNFSLNWFLMQTMGVYGIALSTVLVYAVSSSFCGLALFFSLRKA